MGIPSPINGPLASPLMKLKNPMSPELPLQAVQELDDASKACDILLPPSSIDLLASCGRIAPLKSNRAWADAKDSDASDCGDEQDQQSESSTGLPRQDSLSNESIESRSTGSMSKSNAETTSEVVEATATAEPRPLSTGMDLLQEKGVMKVDVCALVPCHEVPAGMEVAGTLMQMLCRIYRDDSSGMSIVPVMGNDVAADCEHEVFWCFVQPQKDGNVLITPCTDPTACGIFVDASGAPLESASEVVGAPKRPLQGSHIPMWVYGAQAPFTVAPTTLILSSLPDDLTQEDFIEILDKEGYSGFYDFAHIPFDPDRRCNLGYAIVNLTRHEYGLALSALMHGRTSWCGATASECQATWSVPMQGITQIMDHYKDHAACLDDVPSDMRPTFFASGWPRPLPLSENP